jgi:hypothetical protein
MRCLLAIATTMLLTTTVHADDTLPHTRAVLERHAKASRRNRTIGAVVLGGGGVAVGVWGGALVASADGWFADLEKAFGYMFVGLGGLAVIDSVLLVAVDSEYENLRDDVSSEQDARYARMEVVHKAATMRRGRRVVGGIGLALAAGGAAALTVGVLGDDAIEHDTSNELIGSGVAIGSLGALLAIGSLFESRWEEIDRELANPPATAMTPAVVPVRGGVLGAVAGTF